MKFTFGLSKFLFLASFASIIIIFWVKMSSILDNLFLESNKLVKSTDYFNLKIELNIYWKGKNVY
jgi:hypothetical protein